MDEQKKMNELALDLFERFPVSVTVSWEQEYDVFNLFRFVPVNGSPGRYLLEDPYNEFTGELVVTESEGRVTVTWDIHVTDGIGRPVHELAVRFYLGRSLPESLVGLYTAAGDSGWIRPFEEDGVIHLNFGTHTLLVSTVQSSIDGEPSLLGNNLQVSFAEDWTANPGTAVQWVMGGREKGWAARVTSTIQFEWC